ncbi:MAG: hypothetical protein HRF43_09695 [Phycisphaerae bacterium]|jgi:hypothetical protein
MPAKRFDVRTLIQPEWVGLAAALAGGALIYLLLIHPSIRSFAALNFARDTRESAVQELIEVRREHQALVKHIADQKRQLESLGGSPPSLADKENQIARITAIAGECQLAIDQYSPIGEVDTDDYSAVYVAFAGRGSFPNIREFLRRIEANLDYVDVTHFTLTSSPNPAAPTEPACLLTLSCKLSGMPRTNADDFSQPDEARPGEVALHEP